VIGVDRDEAEHVDVVVDLCDARGLEDRLGAAARAAGEPLSGLVNAAGLGYPEPFLEASDESWQRVLDVNVMGTVRTCRLILPLLQAASGDRSIVNFGSQAGKAGGIVIGAHYSASKAAVMCLTKTLAGAYGPEGIRVNAVAPGIVDTPFLDAVPTMRDAGERIPLRRLGTADEVADVVAFLLSPAARYITGEIMDVNGGLLMD
jgi:3-oxoacyl-[acyl-carrier protein] reductase